MAEPFRHEAALYGGSTGFLDATVPFIREGMAAREPVLAAVDADKVRLLRETLGSTERVMFADIRQMGVNPARIIPRWRDFVDRHAMLGGGMRGIGEPIWAGRDDAALEESHRHEALLNHAFRDDESFRLLCPYDTDNLSDTVIAEARETHPFVSELGRSAASGAYDELRSSLPFAGRLPEPVGEVTSIEFDRSRLKQARGFVWERARKLGLDTRAAGELVLAASELASNSVSHGGGAGELRIWRDGDAVLCEVADAGTIADPLAGRAHPDVERLDGRGLWLVNQICDLVQIRSSDEGTVVRVSMRVD